MHKIYFKSRIIKLINFMILVLFLTLKSTPLMATNIGVNFLHMLKGKGSNLIKRNFTTSKIMDFSESSLLKNFEIIIPENGLQEKLNYSIKSGRPLNIKLGFDPTAPDLHLGHSVVLRKLREFQDRGHKLKIIIGDFTACIGDPTGRNKTRPPLTRIEIEGNSKTYLNQLSKIVDVSKADIFYNSTWHDKLNFQEIIHLFSKLTLSQIMQRNDFSNRYNSELPISFHELVYPIIQGYDSIMVDADVEIGGTDQLFNCKIGRDLQTEMGKIPQAVACMRILRGTDGQMKMSKSLKNYIGLTEDPDNMFGKIMSISDEMLPEYITLVSSFDEEEKIQKISSLKIPSINPMLIKKELAKNVVRQYWGENASENALEVFHRRIQTKDFNSSDFINVSLASLQLTTKKINLLDICRKVLSDKKSKGELRRMIQGGGVSVNSVKIVDPDYPIEISKIRQEPLKIKIGKRDFYNLIEDEDL